MILFDFVAIAVGILLIYTAVWLAEGHRKPRPAREKILPQGTPFDMRARYQISRYMRDKIDTIELELELDKIVEDLSYPNPNEVDWREMHENIEKKARLYNMKPRRPSYLDGSDEVY